MVNLGSVVIGSAMLNTLNWLEKFLLLATAAVVRLIFLIADDGWNIIMVAAVP